MLTSSGQGQQLVNGFANRVQRQNEFRGLRPPRYQWATE